jgi:hypothetical protein
MHYGQVQWAAFRDEMVKSAGLADTLARSEHAADLGGLALMAASSGDKLRSQLQHPGDDQKGSLMGGDTGRVGADLAGLAVMTAPTLAMMSKGTGSRFTNAANLAGLAALTAPTLDKLQANLRARREGVDPESKMLMGHNAHALAELGGYGLLSAPVVRGAMHGHGLRSAVPTLAGYGVLAAPAVEDLVQHDEDKRIFSGPKRSATELAGLGLLAGGALAGH